GGRRAVRRPSVSLVGPRGDRPPAKAESRRREDRGGSDAGWSGGGRPAQAHAGQTLATAADARPAVLTPRVRGARDPGRARAATRSFRRGAANGKLAATGAQVRVRQVRLATLRREPGTPPRRSFDRAGRELPSSGSGRARDR